MIIGLHGRAQAGKDTVYERALAIWGAGIVERRSFADKLYESAAAALGVRPADLRDWKTNPAANVYVGGLHTVWNSETVREYLQRYGTEAHRDIFGEDFWVQQLDLTGHSNRLVFVTDVRFNNEAAAIRRAGGKIIEVIGDKAGAYQHRSEAGLTDPPDQVVYNTVRDDGYRALDHAVRDAVYTATNYSETIQGVNES